MAQQPPEPKNSEVTPESLYLRRREFIKSTVLFSGTAAGVGAGLEMLSNRPSGGKGDAGTPVDGGEAAAAAPKPRAKPRGPYDTDETPTSYDDVTTYNNFYEFGLDKGDPAENAHTLKPRPWTVVIDGEVAKPQRVDIDTLLSPGSRSRSASTACAAWRPGPW